MKGAKSLPEREEGRGTPDRGADELRLMHELEVHQVELELQNEELKSARLETEVALERYTELFDFAPIGYALLSNEAIEQLNHAGADILGEARLYLMGRPFSAFVALSDRNAFTTFVRLAHETGAKQRIELTLTRSTERGPRSWRARLSAAALADSDRKTLLSFEDITEEKLREEKLARAEAELRDVNRRKDEFLATLSHELRNPLAPIRNGLTILSRVEPGSEKASQAQVIIERQVTHLTRLIDDLLDVTRIARGKIVLRRERLDFGALVRRTMDDHRASFEASGVRIEERLPDGQLWVDGDPARLVQAVSNLLGNAEKFTPRSGRVVVSLAREDGSAVLHVSDTGVGLAPELLDHVFEPFAQGQQSIDRSRGGLGLGLAMVKGFIELHGGHVSVTSQGRGLGTEATLSLSLAPPPAAVATVAQAASPVKRRILVIEDNFDTASTLREVLALEGHEVRIAHDGASGLALARSFSPEIVICDLGLPGMDGYDVARALRSDAALRGVYLAALSGYARTEDLQHATAVGFDRHVAKPASLDDLDRLVSAATVALQKRRGGAVQNERSERS